MYCMNMIKLLYMRGTFRNGGNPKSYRATSRDSGELWKKDKIDGGFYRV